jgi:hypothetical protein
MSPDNDPAPLPSYVEATRTVAADGVRRLRSMTQERNRATASTVHAAKIGAQTVNASSGGVMTLS